MNPGAEGRLKEARVGGGHRAPLEGVEVGGEAARLVEAPGDSQRRLTGPRDLGPQLALPQYRERAPLRVVVETGQPDEGVLFPRARRRLDFIDQVLALAHQRDVASPGQSWGCHGRQSRSRAGQAVGLLRPSQPHLRLSMHPPSHPVLVFLEEPSGRGPDGYLGGAGFSRARGSFPGRRRCEVPSGCGGPEAPAAENDPPRAESRRALGGGRAACSGGGDAARARAVGVGRGGGRGP